MLQCIQCMLSLNRLQEKHTLIKLAAYILALRYCNRVFYDFG